MRRRGIVHASKVPAGWARSRGGGPPRPLRIDVSPLTVFSETRRDVREESTYAGPLPAIPLDAQVRRSRPTACSQFVTRTGIAIVNTVELAHPGKDTVVFATRSGPTWRPHPRLANGEESQAFDFSMEAAAERPSSSSKVVVALRCHLRNTKETVAVPDVCRDHAAKTATSSIRSAGDAGGYSAKP